MQLAIEVDFSTSVQFYQNDFTVALLSPTVYVAEQEVADCVELYIIWGHFDGTNQFEFARLVVIPNQKLGMSENELIEHVVLVAFEPSVGFQRGAFCHPILNNQFIILNL